MPGTPAFVPDFLKNTLSLLALVGLGIAGKIDSVQSLPAGLVAQTQLEPSFTFGNVAYVGEGGNSKTPMHEYGHLLQEDMMGPAYLPFAAINSGVGNLLYALGLMKPWDYYNLPSEHMADQLGGVRR